MPDDGAMVQQVRTRTRGVKTDEGLDKFQRKFGDEEIIYRGGKSWTVNEVLGVGLKAIFKNDREEALAHILEQFRRRMILKVAAHLGEENKRHLETIARRENEIKHLAAALKSTERRLRDLKGQIPYIDPADLAYLAALRRYGCSYRQLSETFGVDEGLIRSLLKPHTSRSLTFHVDRLDQGRGGRRQLDL